MTKPKPQPEPLPVFALSGALVGPILHPDQIILGSTAEGLLPAVIRGYELARTPAERLAARTAFLAEIATAVQQRFLGNAVRSGAFRFEDCTDAELGVLLSHRSQDNHDADVSGIRVRLVFVAGLAPLRGRRGDTAILNPATALKTLISLQDLSVSLLRLERLDTPSRVRGPDNRR